MIIATLGHSAKPRIPTITWARRGADDQLVALDRDFHFSTKSNLVDERLRNPNAPRVADLDNGRFDYVHAILAPIRCTYIVLTDEK